eukprot:CAMPEP_0196695036 /NCGR_PEP_ID=MMETSP1090-20130531/35592_1 /TAXON_ID=37098 /ORGANISM="Isochrysis sp, Strain CCMP1244" /LENGTH=31 /DNA_ID= /DNA_START= /DNA_END= /DNA_ORIENTATION=
MADLPSLSGALGSGGESPASRVAQRSMSPSA